MPDRAYHPVIVVGGGQAGLAASARLKERGIAHIVLERARVAEAWRSQRWDSFCLVTPNWQCQLPGYSYDGAFGGTDPDGFMLRDEIIAYIEGFRAHIGAPVREGVEVSRLARLGDGFVLETSAGPLSAGGVVVATGGYHEPKLPRIAARLPARLLQLHSSTYRNPGQLPEGEVLVVGSGQSGCQIAEDLHLAGRVVHLATGSAPRAPRFYRGRDVTAWLVDMGHYDITVEQHPQGVAVRRKANHYLTGRDGGRDIDLRRLALEGMRLHGRLETVESGMIRFGDDLAANLDAADATAERIKAEIDRFITDNGIDAPAEASWRPVWSPGPEEGRAVPVERLGSVVWCTGFRMDYGWIDIDVLDGEGYPRHRRGVTPVDGLVFLGLPWMHTWGSGRFSAVGDDARHVVAAIEEHIRAPTALAV